MTSQNDHGQHPVLPLETLWLMVRFESNALRNMVVRVLSPVFDW